MGDSVLITEKRFALSHHAFWRSIIPMAASYIRRCNASLDAFARPMRTLPSDNRGVTNEVAFRLYCESHRRDMDVSELPRAAVRTAVADAVSFIRRFREFGREPIHPPERRSVEEAERLAGRIAMFVRAQRASHVVILPEFAGCGWVDECNGDLLLDDVLCELKSGINLFRGHDLRQILVYLALNAQTRRRTIATVCLANPRRGVYWREGVDTLCRELSGTSSTELIAEIVTYITQPLWRDEAL